MNKHKILLIFAVLLFIPSGIFAQDINDVNILNYYAVGNSLDGQPLINTRNILRFFPVFVFRDNTEKVTVTVYCGKDPFIVEAEKRDMGRYWDSNLPRFDFGESIQRLEVECTVKLDDKIHNSFLKIKEQLKSFENGFSSKFESANKELIDSLKSEGALLKSALQNLIDTSKYYTRNNDTNIIIQLSTLNDILASKLNKFDNFNCEDIIKLKEIIDSTKLISSNILDLGEKKFDKLYANTNEINVKLQNIVDSLYIKRMREINKDFENRNYALIHLEDSLKTSFIDKVTKQFTENKLAGPQLTESDIKFDEDYEHVTMLYRNYKQTLRQLQALDPAEKMGIFRVRYVPFAVTGSKLNKPLTGNASAIFEIGLGFGNVNVSGDDFVKPTLSFDRLGVAFAITDKLFSDDADILALVFTYDFNYYGSIGLGANFTKNNGNNKVEGYFSFGINKTAFERLLVELGKFLGINKTK